jgi:hypothetical protein
VAEEGLIPDKTGHQAVLTVGTRRASSEKNETQTDRLNKNGAVSSAAPMGARSAGEGLRTALAAPTRQQNIRGADRRLLNIAQVPKRGTNVTALLLRFDSHHFCKLKFNFHYPLLPLTI